MPWTPISLAVWIQAHPSRGELHQDLIRSLGPLPVHLSMHASQPPDPWAGYLQVMRMVVAAEEAHHIVLQDDVIACADFPLAVQKVIRERPNEVISLWVGALRQPTTKHYRQAQIKRESWVPIFFRDIHHCVALVWPRALAQDFVTWTETAMLPGEGRNQQSDDAIVGAWARRTKKTFWATIPSLVEHNDDIVSTIGRPNGDAGRRAIQFAG